MTDTAYNEWWEDHRMRIDESDDVRIDVFVRSLGAPMPVQMTQAAIFERLDELEDIGRIDRFNVHIWGDRLYRNEPCSDSSVGRFVQNRIDEFEQWAERKAEVELPFETTSCQPFLADREFHCVTLPRIGLGAYVDGELAGFVPSGFEGVDVSVPEYLDALIDLAAGPADADDQATTAPTAESL